MGIVRAAFFDLDKTVIAKASMVALGPEFHARGLLRKRTLIRGVFLQILFLRFGASEERLAKIRRSVLKITKGWDHDEVRTLVAETLNEIMEPLIYSEALELIRHHLEAGDEVWLVSTSPAEIVEPFAAILGITGFDLVEGENRRERKVHRRDGVLRCGREQGGRHGGSRRGPRHRHD